MIKEYFRRSPFACKRFSELMSRSLDTPLSPSERLSYYFHYFLCFTCRRVDAQVKRLHGDMQNASKTYVESGEDRLPPERVEELTDEVKRIP